jgi:hypothetical protein
MDIFVQFHKVVVHNIVHKYDKIKYLFLLDDSVHLTTENRRITTIKTIIRMLTLAGVLPVYIRIRYLIKITVPIRTRRITIVATAIDEDNSIVNIKQKNVRGK